jgi:taurine dioxygenase
MKQLLGGLIAVNSSAKADVTKTREDRPRDAARTDAKREYIAEHPVVRTHPETGRKAVYVNGGRTIRFKDMTEEERAPLLQFLFAHQQRPEFTCRFRWRFARSPSGTIAAPSTTRSKIITAITA